VPPPEGVLGQGAGGIAEDRQLMRTGEASKVSTATVRDNNAERELKECLCHVVVDYLQPRQSLVCFDVHAARQGCQVSRPLSESCQLLLALWGS
jgi:hypothetical protein